MSTPDLILTGLNPPQLEAVTAPEAPVLVIAGAGSGKTRVITRRIAYLVRHLGLRPHEIFACTFTNKAADEMKRRVAELLGSQAPHEFPIATFHSLCARILRREAALAGLPPSFTICDESDQLRAVRHVMKELGISPKEMTPGDAQSHINFAKVRMLSPDDVREITETPREHIYADIYEAYEKYLAANSALDFEDLILRVVRLFRDNPAVLDFYRHRYRHVLVDEYQDTNAVQFELVRLLAGGHRRLMVVGDEDQSIYSWRGAEISNLLDFQQHFPEARVIRLEQNYRSTGNILRAASVVIARNTERLGKTLFTEAGRGAKIHLYEGSREWDEAVAVAETIASLTRNHGFRHGDIAVFYRMAALSRIYEDRLREYGIPYKVIGGVRFYDRAEIKDLLAYLQVIHNPHNSIALLRILNVPKRGLGTRSLEAITRTARNLGVSDWQVISSGAADASLPKAAARHLSTLAGQIHEWRDRARTAPPADLLEQVLQDTHYIDSLGDPQSLDVRSRIENIEELKSSMIQFAMENPGAGLETYLESVSLAGASDEKAAGGQVSLMTLHSAKGLEFRAVFIVGMEDGIFPNPRAVHEEGRIEEERRLFYVGITRAREVLFLTRSKSRMLYGEPRYPDPSIFLRELPREVLTPLVPGEPEVGDAEVSAAAPPPHTVPAASPRVAAGRYRLGDRVRHAILGEGIITGIQGGGLDTSVLIQLDGGDVHQLLLRYAHLEVLR
jgi:DNA helicase-2/ATP-dependent DNA helicase PcrA